MEFQKTLKNYVSKVPRVIRENKEELKTATYRVVSVVAGGTGAVAFVYGLHGIGVSLFASGLVIEYYSEHPIR